MPTQCLSCISGLLLNETSCVTSCGPRQYEDRGKCLSCHELCMNCTGTSTYCKSCITSAFFKRYECVQDCGIGCIPLANKCVLCPEGCTMCFYNQVNNRLECTQCISQLFLYQGWCQSTCPQGMFGDRVKGICAQCNRMCSTCTGASWEDCMTCNEMAGYVQVGLVCGLPVCVDGSFYNVTTRTCDRRE